MIFKILCVICFFFAIFVVPIVSHVCADDSDNSIFCMLITMGVFAVAGFCLIPKAFAGSDITRETAYVTEHVDEKSVSTNEISFVENGRTYIVVVPEKEYDGIQTGHAVALYRTIISTTVSGNTTEEVEYSWQRPAEEN